MSYCFICSYALAANPEISIDTFQIKASYPNRIEVEISGQIFSTTDLCIKAIAKSNDGIYRSPNVMNTVVSKLGNQTIELTALRPSVEALTKTDVLVITASNCSTGRILSRRNFDWSHEWPAISQSLLEFHNKASGVRSTQNPSEIFYSNLMDRDFDAVSLLTKKWNNQEERDADGDWKLSDLVPALDWVCDVKKWDSCMSFINDWRNQDPNLASLAEAQFWINYAWSVRGGKYATEVDPYAIKLFKERMDKAEQLLKENASQKKVNPLWYEIYIQVAAGKKMKADFTENLFNEAIKSFPTYMPLYSNMAEYWVPRSGELADWRKLDEVINKATAFSYGTDEDANYARLYSDVSLHQRLEVNILEASQVSWLKMKSSFNTMLGQYPSDTNLNRYASFACRANDKNQFLTLRPRLEHKLIPALWPGNFSIDLCDRRFTKNT